MSRNRYIHGFTNTPGVVFEAAKDMNKYLEGKKCFVIPIIWPAEAVDYGAQKEGAPAAAAALRSLLPKLSNNNKVPISLMCHSMGNFLLGQSRGRAGRVDAAAPASSVQIQVRARRQGRSPGVQVRLHLHGGFGHPRDDVRQG